MIIIILNLQSYVDHQERVGVGVGDGEDDRNLDQSCFSRRQKAIMHHLVKTASNSSGHLAGSLKSP